MVGRKVSYIFCFLIAWLASHAYSEKSNEVTLRTAIFRAHDITRFDPINSGKMSDRIITSALYSNLFESNMDRQNISLAGGIAESYQWQKNNTLEIQIRDLPWVVGRVSGGDVAFSFKRVFVKSDSTISKTLARYLCGKERLQSVDEKCDGINYSQRSISLTFPRKLPGIPALLRNSQLAIVPRISVDPKNLNIQDYSKTTGPYRHAGKSSSGHILLKANSGHWNRDKSASTIVIMADDYISIDGKNTPKSYLEFVKGNLDFLPLSNIWYDNSFFAKAIESQPSEVFTTNEMSVAGMVFTKKGFNQMSPKVRRKVSLDIQNQIQRKLKERRKKSKKRKLFGYARIVNQFVAKGAFGSLSNRQIDFLEQEVANGTSVSRNRKTIVGVNPSIISFLKKAIKHNGTYDLREVDKDKRYHLIDVDPGKDALEHPDLIELGVTAGYAESPSTFAHFFDIGLFKAADNKSSFDILDNYLSLSKRERMELFRQIHFDSLFTNPSIIPLWSYPSVAIYRDDWALDISKNSTISPLWLVKKKEMGK
ncbi:hypothetical protein SAMN06296036_111118 [Pseudobacteriovorax antillogorgiicola]|uniref:Solute-binding protein family 5 domain-containing protein n=2 Tax=Pseudobacteriovorax antillogorgiicola TaxID=1513793 RepID=A0A1Y6BZM8_9BACT|nr:hypothetical protein EDD56_11160 [Pseudobacteriovorax antillogorgiicola]SMF37978.1 hypothetical protein SAMN06296036_111118 [Pseudobacteriovorax antillogorgiicola]